MVVAIGICKTIIVISLKFLFIIKQSLEIIGVNTLRVVAEIPGANIKEFLVTILSEAKPPQIQCLSPKGEF
jgi:hypothetical protein